MLEVQLSEVQPTTVLNLTNAATLKLRSTVWPFDRRPSSSCSFPMSTVTPGSS